MDVFELIKIFKTKTSLDKKDTYYPCEPANGSKKSIYEVAADLSQQCEKKWGKIDLFDIVRHFGGNIHTLAFRYWGDLQGSILIHKKNNFDIILPEHTSPLRDRFTLSHELGHYLLHSDNWKKKLWAARQDSNRLEWEANWFAAGFLMPTHKMKEKMKNSPEILAFDLAVDFSVSTDAAEYRLKTYRDLGY